MMHTVSEGDGPVNALDGALRKALEPCYPRLTEMHLADYKVRVVNSRAGTAARVRVVIESRDPGDVWGTVGVSENIIEASWLALVDSIEYKLFKDEGSFSRDPKGSAAVALAPIGAEPATPSALQ
jgi:2-isopropylmalate synthase